MQKTVLLLVLNTSSFKATVYMVLNFIQVSHVFGGAPVRKKKEILLEVGIHLISRVFPWHFYCMRGPSLVELTGYDNSPLCCDYPNINVLLRACVCYPYVLLHSYLYTDGARCMYCCENRHKNIRKYQGQFLKDLSNFGYYLSQQIPKT